MSETDRLPTVPESLISARFLMLQSKRLILATLERRLKMRPAESLRARVDHMRHETADAQEHYRTSLLRWGSPESPQYWPVAYGRLVDTAGRLSAKLRRVAADLPSDERYQLATEVEMIEALTEQWRDSIRSSIVTVA
jgi:hypothetical protein